jgi:hypothetical protein
MIRKTLIANLKEQSSARSYLYWLFGDLAAFLITAGVAVAALGVTATAGRWRARRPGLETVLIAVLVPAALSGLFKGEVDHIWLFLIPLAAAVAGEAVSGSAPALEDEAASGLRVAVAIGLAQAIVTELLLFTFW